MDITAKNCLPKGAKNQPPETRFNIKEGEKKKMRAKRRRKKKKTRQYEKRKKTALSKEKKRSKEGASKNTTKIALKHGFEAKIIGKEKKRGRKEGSQKNRPPSFFF